MDQSQMGVLNVKRFVHRNTMEWPSKKLLKQEYNFMFGCITAYNISYIIFNCVKRNMISIVTGISKFASINLNQWAGCSEVLIYSSTRRIGHKGVRRTSNDTLTCKRNICIILCARTQRERKSKNLFEHRRITETLWRVCKSYIYWYHCDIWN